MQITSLTRTFSSPQPRMARAEVAPARLDPSLLRPKADAVATAVNRMLDDPLEPALRTILVDGLRPYGADLLNRLADHGLKLKTPAEGYAHYSTTERTITYPLPDLRRDQEIPFRNYMILHEMAHALDFLFESDGPQLSKRDDLGISAHRDRLRDLYRPALASFQATEERLRRQGKWGPRPGMPLARVYGEDFITVVEKVTGRQLSERPGRGHLTILDADTNPTEYFADAVYCYLHHEPVTTHRYRLPDGQMIAHPYPPDRNLLAQRDPRMYAALDRFFSKASPQAQDLTVR